MRVERWVQGYMHSLHTGTPGAMNMGGERTAKSQYGPHILAVLRMSDLCGQRGARVKRPLLCSNSTRESHETDICS